MAREPLLFVFSLVFLLGVVLVSLSAFPALQKRFPQALLLGFAFAAGTLVAVFIVALLRA